MGLPFARSKMRGRVAVLGAAALALTAVALTRQQGADAHEVITPYPVTCSMVGLNPTFTTMHTPEAGTTPGGALSLNVNLATPATGMAMQTTRVSFTLPKPALTQRITGVTFRPGTGNFMGTAAVNAVTGLMTLTFTGSAMSNAIDLQDFDIASVTAPTAPVGQRVSWVGPSSIVLTNGTAAVDTCNAAAGAVQFAPTVILDPNPGGCTTTTMDPGHGDHGDHGAPTTACPTTTVPTTSPTTSPTTRPTTAPTTRPTTMPTYTTTTMRPGGGGIWAVLWQLICKLFRLC
jgi:hypothetical protein